MLAFVHELIGNFDVQKERRGINLVLIHGARLFMLPRLSQVRAVAGTIQRHLALLTAALRADAPVDRGTKAFLFANFADRATQTLKFSAQYYVILPRSPPRRHRDRK